MMSMRDIDPCVWSGGVGNWDDPEQWWAKRIPRNGGSALIPSGRAIMAVDCSVHLKKLTVLEGASVVWPDGREVSYSVAEERWVGLPSRVA